MSYRVCSFERIDGNLIWNEYYRSPNKSSAVLMCNAISIHSNKVYVVVESNDDSDFSNVISFFYKGDYRDV